MSVSDHTTRLGHLGVTFAATLIIAACGGGPELGGGGAVTQVQPTETSTTFDFAIWLS